MSDVVKQPAADAAADQSPEVNFALVLSRMIDSVEQDPAQLRATVYELARIKLKEQFGHEDAKEVRRLVGALETAISGVEAFSVQQAPRAALSNSGQQANERLSPANHAEAADRKQSPTAAEAAPRQRPDPSPRNVAAYSDASLVRSRGGQMFGSVVRLGAVIALVFMVGAAAIYWPRLKSIYQGEKPVPAMVAMTGRPQTVMPPATPALSAPEQPRPASRLDFPVPATFGIYAISDGQLHELKPLPGKIPDRRVAMSAAISGASQTMLPNGHVRFIVFRRDAATNAPDSAEIRVIAKVTRAMGVDASGKAVVAPAQDTWVIRNISLPYKTGPIDDHPEMYLVQSDASDAALVPGRYALVIKGQGFDFTVDGAVTDPRQCVERVDAVNGAFYSPCPDRR